MIEEVVGDCDVQEVAARIGELKQKRLGGARAAGDVVGEGNVRPAAVNLPQILVLERITGDERRPQEGVAVDRPAGCHVGLDVIGGDALDLVSPDRDSILGSII